MSLRFWARMDRVVYTKGENVARTSEPLTLSLLATGFLLGGGATAGAIAANTLLDPEHKKHFDEFWTQNHWENIQNGWKNMTGGGSRPGNGLASPHTSTATASHSDKRSNHGGGGMLMTTTNGHGLAKLIASHSPDTVTNRARKK